MAGWPEVGENVRAGQPILSINRRRLDLYARPAVFPVNFSICLIPLVLEPLSALALSALHQVVASSLSPVDVKNLPGHKLRAIQVEYRVHNVGHISHPTHWMEGRQRLMRFWRVHRRLDYSR
jgi:hypothetical protein